MLEERLEGLRRHTSTALEVRDTVHGSAAADWGVDARTDGALLDKWRSGDEAGENGDGDGGELHFDF